MQVRNSLPYFGAQLKINLLSWLPSTINKTGHVNTLSSNVSHVIYTQPAFHEVAKDNESFLKYSKS